MKTIILMTVTVALVVSSIACNTPPNATNSKSTAMDHSSMDHNTMDHNTMNHGTMDHSMMLSSPNAASAAYDLQFLDTMSAHHQGAIVMAGGCSTKAQHAEIKTLCANIISSQQKEISDMKSWRDKWFPAAAPALNMEMAGMSDSMKGMDMKALGSLTGNAYDLAFIKQMIPHHEGAIVMAKEALQKSTKPEIKTLSEAIIKDQESEIKQMKDWQTAWSK